MDVREYNREAWNRQVENSNQWTIPVGAKILKLHGGPINAGFTKIGTGPKKMISFTSK